jgi:hypothetical protein
MYLQSLLSNYGRKIRITIVFGKFNLRDFEQVVRNLNSSYHNKITLLFTFDVWLNFNFRDKQTSTKEK